MIPIHENQSIKRLSEPKCQLDLIIRTGSENNALVDVTLSLGQGGRPRKLIDDKAFSRFQCTAKKPSSESC